MRCVKRMHTVDQARCDPHRHPKTPITISDFGLRVLEDRDDRIRLNGIDRWIGGVHLKGAEAAWRWNQLARQLIPL